MKKKKNKINVKLMPLPLEPLILNNNNKTISESKNEYLKNNKTISAIQGKIKNRSSTIKVNKNVNKNNISSHPPKRLKTNDLIDRKINVLYDWNILLNNKSPGIYYKKDDYNKLSINYYETENDDLTKKSIILLDLPDSQIKKYFGKKSFLNLDKHPKTAKIRKFSKRILNNKEINHDKQNISKNEGEKKENTQRSNNSIINDLDFDSNKTYANLHPKSIYSQREPHQAFYFSKGFDEYYKHDINYYAQMIPSLRAKIKTSNKKLVKEIMNLKYKTIKDSQNLKEFFENDEKIFKVQDLIIAGIRNNPVRLMKNLYMLKHPNYKIMKQDKRKYFKTMKPIGEYFGEIDFTKNERWRNYYELKKLRKKDQKFYIFENKSDKRIHSNKKSNLTLSYYKVTDPHIKFFNNIIRKYNNLFRANEDENEFYKNDYSYNGKKKNKMTETENIEKFEFFRDKLMKNRKLNDNNTKIEKEANINYKNYFITETTKNSINE